MVDVAGWYSPTLLPDLKIVSWADASSTPATLGVQPTECSFVRGHRTMSIPLALGSPLRDFADKILQLTGKQCRFLYPNYTRVGGDKSVAFIKNTNQEIPMGRSHELYPGANLYFVDGKAFVESKDKLAPQPYQDPFLPFFYNKLGLKPVDRQQQRYLSPKLAICMGNRMETAAGDVGVVHKQK